MIRDEDGLLTGYVYVDIAGRDPNGYIEEADRLLREKVKLPAGLCHFLERPVRGHAAGQGAPDGGRARDAVPDPPSALSEHPVPHQDRASSCWRCPFPRSAPSGSSTCSATT